MKTVPKHQPMPDNIVCPKCGAEIPLSDAVTHSLREGFQRDFAARKNELDRAMAVKQQEVEKQRAVLDDARRELDAQVTKRVNVEREKLKADLLKEAQSAAALEMQDLRAQLVEGKKKLEDAQKQELALRKRERDLEDRAKQQELEIERKLSEERRKIQDSARQQAADEQQLRFAEKEKLISDMKSQIESLKQKAEQGSQQMQGEVQELQLEETLRQSFPFDEITSVPTGVRGADLLQKVRGANGQTCGVIIWESKRTRNWAAAWLDKLKEDQRAQGAEIAILVTQVLPETTANFAMIENVWVCGYPLALPLAAALRHQLLAVAATRRAESGKGEKMEALYQFVSSTAFQQQVQGISEAFMEMQNDLTRERVAMEKLWKKREKLIQRILNGTAGLHGSLEGIVGHLALPEIKALELDADTTFDEN